MRTRFLPMWPELNAVSLNVSPAVKEEQSRKPCQRAADRGRPQQKVAASPARTGDFYQTEQPKNPVP